MNTKPDELLRGKIMETEKIRLRLNVACQTPKSVFALKNIKRCCKQYMECEYPSEVIDLLKNSQLAEGDQIFAIPHWSGNFLNQSVRSLEIRPMKSEH